jgi:hypothetical protein
MTRDAITTSIMTAGARTIGTTTTDDVTMDIMAMLLP